MAEIITNTDVKNYLGISGTTYDTLLTTLIGYGEGLMAKMADRRDDTSGMVGTGAYWGSGSHTEKRPGALHQTITLRYWPVTVVSSVTIYSSSGSNVDLGSYLYRIDADQKTLRFLGQQQVAWDAGFSPPDYPMFINTINTEKAYPYTQITYTGGFSTIPADLKAAAVELVSQMFLRRQRDRTLSSETLGNHSWTANPGGFNEWLENEFKTVWMANYMGIGAGYI